MITVALDNNASVIHDVIGKFGSASVLLKNAPDGTGVIAEVRPCRDRNGGNQKHPYKISWFKQ